jgi:hypothetical protein
MKVKALRGICIGVGRHLRVDDVEDLEPALVTYLVGIGAVERVPDEPPKPEPPAKVEAPPIKTALEKSGGKEK